MKNYLIVSLQLLQKITDYFKKTPYLKPTFQTSKNTDEQLQFMTMFKLQHSQINQQKFEKLEELLLKYPMVYATSKLSKRLTILNAIMIFIGFLFSLINETYNPCLKHTQVKRQASIASILFA